MATLSYKAIEEKLKNLAETATADNLGYKLLSAFGMTDTSVERVRDGKGNLDKDGGILVKKKLAYRPVETGHAPSDGDETRHATSDGDETQHATSLQGLLQTMKTDARIAKAEPGIIAVSDGVSILAYDPWENESYAAPVSSIYHDYNFFYPISGEGRRNKTILENDADVRAAEKMAKLYDEIRRHNDITTPDDVHNLNIFLTRVLFCYFAEDTGIFDTESVFTDSIRQYTKDDGSDLSMYLDEIFRVMNLNLRIGIPANISQFPYVNGGLFAKHIPIPQLGWKARQILLDCGSQNWAKINPDIFGSMIQAVVTPENRGNLGMHYTSVPNIMKLIQPLFLDDLHADFYDAHGNEKKLNALLVRIGKIKLFDPACGSGNFLIIAYKELRKLEMLIWERIREITGQAVLPYVSTQLTQFYGIELDDFAHETALLALWLTEHQMNNAFQEKFTVQVKALPLRPSGNIVQGNACRVDWNTVCPHTEDEEVYVMGNPPYLGARLQSEEQKADMTFCMSGIIGINNLDYIACWFYKGAKFIKDAKSKFAFVSTNSICQGEQVSLLWTHIFKYNLEIAFAYTSFKWTNNAKGNAGVTVIIVGVQNSQKNAKTLYHGDLPEKSDTINAYLTAGSNVIVSSKTKSISNLPTLSFGNMANDGGTLLLEAYERNEIIEAYPTANQFIKYFLGSQEFIREEEKFCLWITAENKELAYSIPQVKARIDKCEKIRLESKREATAKLAAVPYQFGEVRHQNSDSIIIPAVSSERREYIPMGFLNSDTIISNSAFAIYDAQLWLFGILTSKMHMAWVKTVGGRLKSDYRYSAQLCYNTFPFPKISDNKRQALEEAALEVRYARAEHVGDTLAQMYDPDKMPDDLREAHHVLDVLVDSCYREKPFENDEERLEVLFRLYEKMVK